MISARLEKIDKREVLRYLGASLDKYPKEELDKVSTAIDMVFKSSEPKIVYKRVILDPEFLTGIGITGHSIGDILENCDETVIFAATIGSGIDKLISKYMITDMSLAVILDTAASSAIEDVCDNFENDMRTQVEAEGLFLSERFSPGYGDLPIDCQGRLCQFLNSQRRIGLTAADNSMMTPIKSVTAIMGISKERKKCRIHKCESCQAAGTCPFKAGKENEK